uniref:Uncharacterized protein n=1 Tax=Arundo donax TaxID=35708 RepID=A0A0A9H2Z4_ARUDO
MCAQQNCKTQAVLVTKAKSITVYHSIQTSTLRVAPKACDGIQNSDTSTHPLTIYQENQVIVFKSRHYLLQELMAQYQKSESMDSKWHSYRHQTEQVSREFFCTLSNIIN